MGGLRIPDTPEPEEEPKAEERRVKQSESERAESESINDSSSSCSSSLSSPLLKHCLEGDGEQAAGAAGSGTTAVVPAAAAAGPETLIGSANSDTGSGSDSPDLLRSYAMGTKSLSQEPTCTMSGARSRDQCGSGFHSGGGTVGSASKGQSASEESDTGSDSSDLLRAYPVVDSVLEEPKRAAGRTNGQQSSQHQTAFAPSARPGQEHPSQPHSRSRLDAANLAADAHKYPTSRCRQPTPCVKAEGGGMSRGKRRGIAPDGSTTSPEEERGGATAGEPPVQKTACGEAGAGERAGRDKRGGSSAVARPGSLPERGAIEARARDREGQNGAAVGSRGPPRFATPPPAGGSVDGRGAACDKPSGTHEEIARSSSPVLSNTSDPTSDDGGSTARGVAGADHVPPATTTLQPAPTPSAGDARLVPAGTNSCETRKTAPAGAPKGPGLQTSVAPNPYHYAHKDAGLASANVPNPYAAATGGQAPAAGVRNPYSTTAGRPPAGAVVNPYSAAGAATPRATAAPVPVRLAARSSSFHAEEAPKVRAEPSQAQQSSSAGSSATPPEVRFETARQQLYKNPRSAATGRGWRGRGRGWGGGRGAGRGGKRGSTAPRPAQDALVGVWRNKPPRKKGERGSR